MRSLQYFIIFFGLITIGGCGSSSSPPQSTPPPPVADSTGTAVVGLTDAPGDFLSYQVEVTGLRFERANGAVIEVLPETTSLDFATYVEATELVTIATLPSGVYTSVTLALDYTNSSIVVENLAGQAVEATVVDSAGNPISATQVRVSFPAADRFVIAPGVPAHVTLDFDLEASHKIDLLDDPTATLDSVLLADTLLDFPKIRRARGVLRSVDVASSTLNLVLRPFFHPRGDFGAVTLQADAATEYEIDQTPYTGNDGLAALSSQPAGTALVAAVRYDRDANRLIAERIVAGSSVPWSQADIASGSVAARSGDVLTLRGATYVRQDMSVAYNQTLAVTLGAQTRIRQIGPDLQPLAAGDISVGQRLTVLGQHDSNGTLDARDGLVRIDYATLSGAVTAVGPLSVELSRYNGRRPGLFDFTGTGSDPTTDADIASYDIDTGTLDMGLLNIGDPVRVRGHVTPFGSAPQDFVARTVASVADVPGRVRVRWQSPGDAGAVLLADDRSLVIDLQPQALTPIRTLNQSGVVRDLLGLGSSLDLGATQSGAGVFAVRVDGQMMMYFRFEQFTAALTAALDGSRGLLALRGEVVPGIGNAFVARRMTAIVSTASEAQAGI